MTDFVLDASALIAMLREEPGAIKVADAIADARMSVFNYAEVVSYFIYGGMDQYDIDAMLDPLPVKLVPADRISRGWLGTCAIRRQALDYRSATASVLHSLNGRACPLGLPTKNGKASLGLLEWKSSPSAKAS